MNINIKVIAGAGRNLVKEEANRLKVYVAAPATEGRANRALVEVLANHFGVKKNCVSIIKGLKSPNKTVIIKDIL